MNQLYYGDNLRCTNTNLAQTSQTLRSFFGENDRMAYQKV